MHHTLQPILALLDEGLRLYRRNFTSFTLIAVRWCLPVVLGIGVTIGASRYGFETLATCLTIADCVFAVPLTMYLVADLSRAALAASTGVPLRVRNISPLRAAGMSVFALVFSLAANVATSTVMLCVVCPVYGVLFGVVGGLARFDTNSTMGGTFGIALVAVFGVLFVLIYVLALVLGGAIYTGLVYALQAFIQENVSFGIAFGRAFAVVSDRFGQQLLAFTLASAVFGGMALAVTLAVGTLVPLPLLWLLGNESPFAQSASVVAWLLGLVLVLPPLPIWMALWYQRNRVQREGWDLAARVATMDRKT